MRRRGLSKTARLLRNPPFRVYPSAAMGAEVPAAVHVVRGDSAGGALKATGANPVIVAPDNLASGPASAAPGRHRRLRLSYWRGEWSGASNHDGDGSDDLPDADAIVAGPGLVRAMLATERGRVLIWASGSWSDLLFLAWAADALRHGRIAPDRVGVTGPITAASPLGGLNPAQLVAYGYGAVALGPPQAASARALWEAFTARTPAVLERLRGNPYQPFPTLRREAAVYAAFLPRFIGRSRRLHLPEVDEALLGALSERDWRSLPDLIRTPPSRARWPTSGIFAMLRAYGDLFIEARLRRWSRSPSAAVEAIKRPGQRWRAFRLTARGRRLLERGLEDAGVLPRTRVGGHEVGKGALWVCALGVEGWRLRKA